MKDESRMSPEDRDDYLNWCESEKCAECGGHTGWEQFLRIGEDRKPMYEWIECPRCKGTGRV